MEGSFGYVYRALLRECRALLVCIQGSFGKHVYRENGARDEKLVYDSAFRV